MQTSGRPLPPHTHTPLLNLATPTNQISHRHPESLSCVRLSHLTGLLSASEKAALDMPDNSRIGCAAVQTCPNLPAPLPPMAFCRVTLTSPLRTPPASVPLRARRSAVALRPGTSLNLSPQDTFNTCPPCYLLTIVLSRKPIFCFIRPTLRGWLGSGRRVVAVGGASPRLPRKKLYAFVLALHFCVKTILGEDNPRSFGINGIQMN